MIDILIHDYFFSAGLQNQNGRQWEHLGEANIEEQRLRQEHHRGERRVQ